MNVETGTILGLIGIALTIYSIYLVFRKWHPGRVTFIRERSIALFDTIVKNFPEIQVLFEGTPVLPDLVLLNGALVNTGRKDITPSMTEMPIEISVPQGFEWLMAKVISGSTNLEANITVKDKRHLVLESGLFRQEEFVRFQALARVSLVHETGRTRQESLSEKLERSLSFSHRIADTGPIDMKKLQDGDHLERVVKKAPLFVALITLFAIGLAVVNAYVIGWPGLLVYSYNLDNKSTVEVKVNPRSDGSLKLEGTKEWFLDISDIKKFAQRSSGPNGIVPRDTFFDWLLHLLPLPFILGCGWVNYYLDYRRHRKILKMLNIES